MRAQKYPNFITPGGAELSENDRDISFCKHSVSHVKWQCQDNCVKSALEVSQTFRLPDGIWFLISESI